MFVGTVERRGGAVSAPPHDEENLESCLESRLEASSMFGRSDVGVEVASFAACKVVVWATLFRDGAVSIVA